jgi:hypothetical protein
LTVRTSNKMAPVSCASSLRLKHIVSPFYNKCLKVLNIFIDKCNDVVLGQYV